LADALQNHRPNEIIDIIIRQLASLQKEKLSFSSSNRLLSSLEIRVGLENMDLSDDDDGFDAQDDLGDQLINNQDGDDDDLEAQDDWEAEFKEDDEDDDVPETDDSANPEGKGMEIKIKEPSRRHLQSLQAVLKILLESPFINEKINVNWVHKTAYAKSDFTDNKCQVVANIANLLRPYIPKYQTALKGSIAHITLRAPIVFIANAVLRATGYHNSTRLIIPQISPSSIYSLLLSSIGMYEVFCSKGMNQFDITDINGEPLTYKQKVTKPKENKRRVFGAFFNLEKIDKVCQSHGLRFANRITYVDRYTLHITGKVIPHGSYRNGHPISSQYNERKKIFSNHSLNWMKKYEASEKTKDEVEKEIEQVADAIKTLEEGLKKERKMLATKETIQSKASYNHKIKNSNDTYQVLQAARKEVREVRGIIIPKEAILRQMRKKRYYWNNILNGAKTKEKEKKESEEKIDKKKSKKEAQVKLTTSTWSHFTVEDSTECLDISNLITNHQGKNMQVVFSGTDYGINKMSETCALTLAEVESHVNRYNLLFKDDNNTEKMNVDENNPSLDKIKLPHSFKITAPYINEISHTRKLMKCRENSLKKIENKEALEALHTLSQKEYTLKTAQTMSEIDTAHKIHKKLGQDLKNFEYSKSQLKNQHNQQLRTKRMWAKLGAAERNYVKEHARKEVQSSSSSSSLSSSSSSSSTVSQFDGFCTKCNKHHICCSPQSSYSHPCECPKSCSFILPVMLIGTAGTGVNSRIKGHARRGGGKMREQHRRHCTIGMTNEYRSSQTCVWCFQQTRLARSRRIINGRITSVKIHGAVECINPSCISFKCGYTIKPRDPHSAIAIAIAGASILLSTSRSTLPPFSSVYTSTQTINTSQYILDNTSSTYSQYQKDTMGVSSGQEDLTTC